MGRCEHFDTSDHQIVRWKYWKVRIVEASKPEIINGKLNSIVKTYFKGVSTTKNEIKEMAMDYQRS